MCLRRRDGVVVVVVAAAVTESRAYFPSEPVCGHAWLGSKNRAARDHTYTQETED